MTDTCTIRKPPTRGTLDKSTGRYPTTPGAVTYEGPCEVKMGGTAPRSADVAGQSLVEQQSVLKLPIGSSLMVGKDDVVQVTASRTDAALVGRTYRIAGPFAGTHTTSRRFPVEEVS